MAIHQRFLPKLIVLKGVRLLNRPGLVIIAGMGLSQEDKERFLKALEEDKIFRYAVMGLLGIQELIKGQEELRNDMRTVKAELRRLNKTVDRITAALEDEANDVVTYYLRQHGINIETSPVRLDSVYEFDIYGSNGQYTIVGEAKTRVSRRMVERITARVRNAVNAFPSKFPGKVITVIYCMRADPEAIEEARKQGIWLLESVREKTPFPG